MSFLRIGAEVQNTHSSNAMSAHSHSNHNNACLFLISLNCALPACLPTVFVCLPVFWPICLPRSLHPRQFHFRGLARSLSLFRARARALSLLFPLYPSCPFISLSHPSVSPSASLPLLLPTSTRPSRSQLLTYCAPSLPPDPLHHLPPLSRFFSHSHFPSLPFSLTYTYARALTQSLRREQ